MIQQYFTVATHIQHVSLINFKNLQRFMHKSLMMCEMDFKFQKWKTKSDAKSEKFSEKLKHTIYVHCYVS
jgi:hypothetical protein